MKESRRGGRALAISLPTKNATVGARINHEGVLFHIERIICKATDDDDTTIVAARRVDGRNPTVRIRNQGWNHGLYRLRGAKE